jgi:hypothetical protein
MANMTFQCVVFNGLVVCVHEGAEDWEWDEEMGRPFLILMSTSEYYVG